MRSRRLPDSTIRGARSHRLSVSVIRGVGDFPTQQYGESATHRITGAGSWQLSVSSIQRVFFKKNSIADSPYRWCVESPTPHISDAGSRRLPDSTIRGVVFPIRISPRIRSQNWNGPKGSVRDSWVTNFCKNPRKFASLQCPFKLRIRNRIRETN